MSKFQLTHPWGCDAIDSKFRHLTPHISTHTPVRVWRLDVLQLLVSYISTHTPVRVWRDDSVLESKDEKFQLTHPWGCDRTWRTLILPYADFNSHTREGVTMISCQRDFKTSSFQLTHPWGCDVGSGYPISILEISTHTPVRVWLNTACYTFHYAFHFNSHTREGVTCNHRLLVRNTRFQLTHPWGCDGIAHQQYQPFDISTHTPVRVWLPWKFIIAFPKSLFQLTHPWGCDWTIYQ